jgi:hypothetical protein
LGAATFFALRGRALATARSAGRNQPVRARARKSSSKNALFYRNSTKISVRGRKTRFRLPSVHAVVKLQLVLDRQRFAEF